MSKITEIATTVWSGVKKHSPEILIGLGIAGMISTTVMAVRATPKALRCIADKKDELQVESLEGKDIVQATWKCYVPAFIVGMVSTACLIGASSIHFRRNAALATAYTLSETALKEYQSKVVETIGQRKEQTIKDAVAKEKITQDPVREVILTEKGGTTICYDACSGRYFKSDIETIKRAINELNRRMRDDMYISLNDFYYEIGLDSVKLGDDLGWNIDKGYIDIDFSSQLDANGTPCLVLNYRVAPVYDYM